MIANARADLHHLIDQLDDDDVERLHLFAQHLHTGDPVLRTLALAPYDDEPETEEERAAVEEARAEAATGTLRSMEDVRRELGL